MTLGREYELDVSAILSDIEDQVLKFKQKIALQALSGVVMRTPVDTGRARGNNHVSISQPSEKTLAVFDRNGSTAIAAGQSTIFSDRDAFSRVFIQNNLPYILRLENGWSPQARNPNGMYAVTVAQIEAQFK